QIMGAISRTTGGSIGVTPPRGTVPLFVNVVREFQDALNGIEAALLQFAETPKTSTSETATSRLARIGVTLTPLQQAIFDFQRFYNRYGLADPPNPPSGP